MFVSMLNILRLAQLPLAGLTCVHIILVSNWPTNSTQPGHPSMGRYEYWQ